METENLSFVAIVGLVAVVAVVALLGNQGTTTVTTPTSQETSESQFKASVPADAVMMSQRDLDKRTKTLVKAAADCKGDERCMMDNLPKSQGNAVGNAGTCPDDNMWAITRWMGGCDNVRSSS